MCLMGNSLGTPDLWLLWYWLWIDHCDFHGMALWVMHWDSMDLHWGWPIGNAMEVLYG